MSVNGILFFVLGIIVGYGVFWFFYVHKDIVSALRKQLKEANDELQILNQSVDKLKKENEFLKIHAQEVLKKNEDLTKVVSELSKYYYYQLEAYKKSQELLDFLKQPDPTIEENMKKFLENGEKNSEETKKGGFF